jgi:hypothetical protein
LRSKAHRRTLHALACLLAFGGSIALTFALLALTSLPTSAQTFDDPQSRQMMALLGGQPCGAGSQAEQVAQVTPSPSPSPSFSPVPVAPGAPYATPFPTGSPQVTPPPVPTPTPVPSTSPGPIFLQRGSAPPSIAPAQEQTPSPSPEPSAVPTLKPGYVAVMADKITGSTKPGVPGDATGNVHIFYRDEVLVGERAHYDGIRTITVSGNPYIINNTKNSILYADKITFDTVAEKAELFHGRGESSQGVEQGLVYFTAKDLKSDEHGVSHGVYASVTTCARPRAGYHLTGRTIDIFPGDRIVITKAILWLGAAAVFWLPRVVIPLRTVSDERRRPQFFPEVGYNQYQGFYVRARLSFGKDQYYYGYYTIEFYTKQGTTLGYDGTIAPRSGKRIANIDVQRIENKLQGSTQYNINATDQENFSRTLRGQFGYSYQGNYGPLVNFPPNSSGNATLTHSSGSTSQSFTFHRSTTAGQASSDGYGFSDTRSFSATLQNSFTASLTHSQSTYGSFFSENATGSVNDQLHWANRAADYMLTYDKTFAKQPYGVNKEPELQIRPNVFATHFLFPVQPTLTIGEYNEPQTPETTMRADLGVSFGPWLYRSILGDFSASSTVHQFYYGTGDMKASVQQQMSLNSQIGTHFTNNVSYSESNYNGPGTVPFATMDVQSGQNFKNASDILRIFNGDIYNLNLTFTTSFNGIAQPITYQLISRPSRRSYVQLQGTFIPGSGNGFPSTNVQFTTPFGNGSWLQFVGDLDWKNKGRIENKSIYYSRIIGDCYEIQMQYNQNSRTVNVTLNLLAFPSHAAGFGINTNGGSIIPSSFNGFNFSGP